MRSTKYTKTDMALAFTGHDSQTDRELLIYVLPKLAVIPSTFDLEGTHFVAMLVCNAGHASVGEIAEVANKLIDAGCAHVCCWGNDCEKIHDIFDEVWVGDGTIERTGHLMTSWHADETLDDFIHFSMATANPTDENRLGCRSLIALVVDDPESAKMIQQAFANPSSVYGTG
jgi:hypothetical protein